MPPPRPLSPRGDLQILALAQACLRGPHPLSAGAVIDVLVLVQVRDVYMPKDYYTGCALPC